MSDNAKNDSNGDTSMDSQNNTNLNDENAQNNASSNPNSNPPLIIDEQLAQTTAENSVINTNLGANIVVNVTSSASGNSGKGNPPPGSVPHVNVVSMPVGDLMKKNYLNYAVAVIMDRALPDVRDGLKPVHRRILYAMHELKMMPGTAYKKSARMVGECMGKFHPHGDSAIYDAAVAMAQPWNKNVPLIDGQGNFGSVDGDNAAAMRYSEMRLTKAGAAFFEDIEKNTVNFRDNYDGAETEPEVLPVSYPNIWVNGVDGIAVGMATYLPPHNLNETIDLTLALQVNPNITIEEVLKIIPGPDFPTGGIVHELDGFKNAIITGKGSVRVRSRWHSESVKNASHELLILDEIPYKVNKKTLVEDISDKVRAINKNKDGGNELADIVDIHDESNKEGIRVVITLRKGAIPAVVFNHLVKKTEVESSYSYNVMLLEGQSPKQMGLIEILKKFLEFRREVIERKVAFDLKKAGDRLHLLSGMMTVLAQLSLAVDIIMQNKDSKSANAALVAQFSIDETQAQAILDMKLQRLTGMEIDNIKEDFEQVTSRVLDMKHILANPERVQEIIKNDLLHAKARFGQDRLTEVSYENNSIDMMDLIKEEQCLIHVTKNGYLKRMPLDLLEAQKRNGKGRMGIQTNDDDYVDAIYSASSHDQFMVFTKSGKAMSSQVWRLPDGTTAQKGRHLRNIFENLTEEVASILILPRNETAAVTANATNIIEEADIDDTSYDEPYELTRGAVGEENLDEIEDDASQGPIKAGKIIKDEVCVVTVTAKGKVKRTALSSYAGTMRKNGVQGVGIEEGDTLVASMLAKTGDELMLVSSNGKAAVFEINNESLQIRGRKSVGVKGMDLGYKTTNEGMSEEELAAIAKLEKNLPVIISAMVIPQDEFNSTALGVEKYLLCVGENGVGKRTRVAEFTPHSRGTKGVTCLNINEKTGRIVKSALVTEIDDLMMTTSQKTIRIKVVDIKAASRNTAGTMLMNVEGEKLIDVAVVPTQSEEEMAAEIVDSEMENENNVNDTINVIKVGE